MEQDASGLAEVGFGFMVSGGYLSEGATLSGDQGARAIHSETDEQGVRKLILGGAGKRLSLVSAEPARLKVFGGRALRMVLLLPAGTEESVFELVTDFTQERANARSVLSSARKAKAAGRMGEAMINYARVVNEFPFDEGTRQQAKNELAEIAMKGKARLDHARALFDGARDFYDVADITAARDEAVVVAADYDGFKLLADDAVKLEEEAGLVLADIRNLRDEFSTSSFLKRAEDCARRKETHLAEAFRKAAESIKEQ